MNYIRNLVCAGAVVATLGFTVQANTIYDSFANANGNAFSLANGQEVGNEIAISPGTWSLTNFQIEYYSPNYALNPNVAIDVRFYLNDGTQKNGFNTPGTLFFDSGWWSNPSGPGLPAAGTNWVVTYNSSDFYGGSTVNMANNFVMPGDFTFTVSFTNLNAGNVIDLPLANNQVNANVVSYGDYWLNNGGNWTLMTNATSAANFVVDFAGNTVPEPTTFGLAAIGGVLLLGINKLRRKI